MKDLARSKPNSSRASNKNWGDGFRPRLGWVRGFRCNIDFPDENTLSRELIAQMRMNFLHLRHREITAPDPGLICDDEQLKVRINQTPQPGERARSKNDLLHAGAGSDDPSINTPSRSRNTAERRFMRAHCADAVDGCKTKKKGGLSRPS